MLPKVTSHKRRRFSQEFKRQLVDQCQPGVSVTGIAMANGINPNQLRRWIRQYRAEANRLSVGVNPAVKLVPVSILQSRSSDAADSMIEITLSGKKRSASLRWPVSSAAGLAALLREVLA